MKIIIITAMLKYSSASKVLGVLSRLFFFFSSVLDNLIGRREFKTDGVHTVSLIRGRWETLSLEDMAQVTSTIGAHDLDALHE